VWKDSATSCPDGDRSVPRSRARPLWQTSHRTRAAARSVYRLTPSGSTAVLPILRAVARLGAPYLDDDAPETFDAHRAVNALLAPW
jgi:hypothetical protein